MSGAYAIIKNMCKMKKCMNIITTHFDVLAGMDEVCVDKKYFDIEIDENNNIKGDYKIRDGVSKKHMALKLLKKKGFDESIIADAEYMYDKLQCSFLEKSRAKKEEENILEVIEEEKQILEKAVPEDTVHEGGSSREPSVPSLEPSVLSLEEKTLIEEKKVIEENTI
jgi:DNA mismatch repair ATPase MutS